MGYNGFNDNYFMTIIAMMGSGVAMLVTALLIMFFLVLAFAKDKIESVSLFRWALICFSLSLLIPLVSYSIMIAWTYSAPTAYGGRNAANDPGMTAVISMVVTILTPAMFVASVILGLFAMVPKRQFANTTSAIPAEPKKHPLDD